MAKPLTDAEWEMVEKDVIEEEEDDEALVAGNRQESGDSVSTTASWAVVKMEKEKREKAAKTGGFVFHRDVGRFFPPALFGQDGKEEEMAEEEVEPVKKLVQKTTSKEMLALERLELADKFRILPVEKRLATTDTSRDDDAVCSDDEESVEEVFRRAPTMEKTQGTWKVNWSIPADTNVEMQMNFDNIFVGLSKPKPSVYESPTVTRWTGGQ